MMIHVLEGLLWEELQTYLNCHDVLSMRTSANNGNDASKYGPKSELFFHMKKEPNETFEDFVSAI